MGLELHLNKKLSNGRGTALRFLSSNEELSYGQTVLFLEK